MAKVFKKVREGVMDDREKDKEWARKKNATKRRLGEMRL